MARTRRLAQKGSEMAWFEHELRQIGLGATLGLGLCDSNVDLSTHGAFEAPLLLGNPDISAGNETLPLGAC